MFHLQSQWSPESHLLPVRSAWETSAQNPSVSFVWWNAPRIWRDFGSALPFQTRLTQTKPVLPLSNEYGSQVKDQGRRQCCHNKHKKVSLSAYTWCIFTFRTRLVTHWLPSDIHDIMKFTLQFLQERTPVVNQGLPVITVVTMQCDTVNFGKRTHNFRRNLRCPSPGYKGVLFYYEAGGTRFVGNVGAYVPNCITSHPRKHQTSEQNVSLIQAYRYV